MTKSHGGPCTCSERAKPVGERRWSVGRRNFNESAFNGYHRTPSAYSDVVCGTCGSIWRTNAKFVADLPDYTAEQALTRVEK